MLLVYYCMQWVDKIQSVSNIVEVFSCRQHCDKFMNDASVQHAKNIFGQSFCYPNIDPGNIMLSYDHTYLILQRTELKRLPVD